MIQYLNHYVSDQTLLVCQLGKVDRGKGRSFRFLNYIADHMGFLSIVEAARRTNLEGSAMEKVWRKLKCVKKALKDFHVHQFQNIHDNILKRKRTLEDI